VRLDLAGGWTDTPPYCLEHGGCVLNMAVDLNGQPPIQVFIRPIPLPQLVLRSIDLGVGESLTTHEDVGNVQALGSPFAIARAALALAGFHPRFNGASHGTLADQLRTLGGGFEISTLAAVPKGSGLGTSSILAATLLGALSECCGLGWTHEALFRRTLALEQLVTSGGGWQDQIGGLLHGVKLIETAPGLEQKPIVYWLPEHIFADDRSGGLLMLYYTGITRVAHDILGGIVQRMLEGDAGTQECLTAIRHNAVSLHDAIRRQDRAGFAESLRRSWDLNQRIDPGSNPPPVRAILDRVAPHLAAAKLTGAGGGGYLLMLARDLEAARAIRHKVDAHPPNPRARFVDISLSRTGLQITRS
jgi:galactokinase/mevalonate kinase-like predicted kinase